MATAQQRSQKPNMFRRILSPREKKHDKDKGYGSLRTSSMSELNGHRREDQLQNSMEIENTEYRDPERLHQQHPPAAGIALRSQSMICSPVDGNNPPLPPRNHERARPASVSNPHPLTRKQSSSDPNESELYVEPANTLKNAGRSAVSNYTQVETNDVQPTKQDLKQMTMYRHTMEQSMEQKSGRGHRRVRSFGHVIDKSEYSTPFDLLRENDEAKRRGEAVLTPTVRASLNQPQRSASDKPPPKPPHVRKIRQAEPLPDNAFANDAFIPVVSPTSQCILSDRSHTNSPSSPHSNHSSEQELIRDDGTNDYDEPWDRKFRDLPRVRANNSKPDSQIRHTHLHHHDHTHFSEQPSPPSPSGLDRPRRPYQEREQVSISPELPGDLPQSFVKGGPERSSGRYDRSSSPLPTSRSGRTLSQPQPPYIPGHFRDHMEPGVRTSSMSMANRLLPPTPPDRAKQWVLNREPSPPPAQIDISIPLDDQPWYHGSITRAQAETVLIDQPDFSFLVRDSESNNTNFSLSIRDYSSGFIHLRVIREAGPIPGYVLGQFSGSFTTVQECISFYTREKLNIRGADHKRLGLPVPRPNNLAKYRM